MTEKYISKELLTEKKELRLFSIKGGGIQKKRNLYFPNSQIIKTYLSATSLDKKNALHCGEENFNLKSEGPKFFCVPDLQTAAN